MLVYFHFGYSFLYYPQCYLMIEPSLHLYSTYCKECDAEGLKSFSLSSSLSTLSTRVSAITHSYNCIMFSNFGANIIVSFPPLFRAIVTALAMYNNSQLSSKQHKTADFSRKKFKYGNNREN